jgi:hypothetical protein
MSLYSHLVNSNCVLLQVLAYTGNEDARKFFLDGEVSLEAIKVIAEYEMHRMTIANG